MFNIPMAQAYTEIQLSNISPWHIPISTQRNPTPWLLKDKTSLFSSVSGQAVACHMWAKGQHISAPQDTTWIDLQCSAHPWHLSLHNNSGWNSHKPTAVLVGRDCWSPQACCKREVGALPALPKDRCSFVWFCLKNLKAQTAHRYRVP